MSRADLLKMATLNHTIFLGVCNGKKKVKIGER